MRSVFMLVLLLALTCALHARTPYEPCWCDNQAGCQAVGCDCISSCGRIFTPPTRPPQGPRDAGCAPCPKVVCERWYVRFACKEANQNPCNTTLTAAYVPKFKVQILPIQDDVVLAQSQATH